MFLRHGLIAPLAAASLICVAAAPTAHGETAAATTGVANLHITMDDSYPANGVSPGSSASAGFTIVAANDGPDTALATIQHSVVLLTAWNCTATGGATCPAASGGNHINHTIEMPPGARVRYSMQAGMVPVQSAFMATATITADQHDNALDDNTAITITPVFHPDNANLAVAIDADRDGTMPGDTVNYAITAHNAGTIATYAVIHVLHSAYLGQPTWTCGGDAGVTCNDVAYSNRLLSQNVWLPPGAIATLDVSARLTPVAAAGAGDEVFVQRAWVANVASNDLATADNSTQAIGHVSLFSGTFDD